MTESPVFCSSFVLNNILRAEGKASLSMFGLCSGGILNIGLDALFIFGLQMGVVGAAVATVLSQLFSFCIPVIFFLAGKSEIRVNPLMTSRNPMDYLNVFRVGLPTVFRQSLGSVATTLLNIAVRPYGDTAMSAVSIANKIYMLLRSMLIGVGQGFQPVAGFNYGAKRYDRVRKSFNAAIMLGTVYGVTAAAVLFFFSGSIIGWFRAGIPRSSPRAAGCCGICVCPFRCSAIRPSSIRCIRPSASSRPRRFSLPAGRASSSFL